MPGKDEVAVPETKTGVVEPYARVRKFEAYMRERAVEAGKNRAEDIEDQQVMRILDAQTAEDIWNADQGSTIQGKDCAGMEVEIRGFESVISKREDIKTRQGYYISMDTVCLGGPAEVLRRLGLAVGEQFVLQTGAPLIVGKIRAFEAKGLLPVKGVIIGIDTQSGNTLLKFRPLPVRAATA